MEYSISMAMHRPEKVLHLWHTLFAMCKWFMLSHYTPIAVHCLLRVIPPLDVVVLMNDLGLSSHI